MSAPIVPVAAPAASRLADWAARGRDDQAARAAAIAPTAVSRSGTDSSDDSDAHSYFSDGSSDSEFGRRATNARDRYAAEERARATAAATAAANSDEKIISDWYSRMRRYINYANELYDNIFTAERAVDDGETTRASTGLPVWRQGRSRKSFVDERHWLSGVGEREAEE